jgi:3-keto-disaccharide hydrolase
MNIIVRLGVPVLLTIAAIASGLAQAPTGYQDTPLQPNGKWRIHDGSRPQPPIVVPPEITSAGAPSDATVLLDRATGASQWQHMDGSPVTWPVADGVLASGKGMIRTKAEFSDLQLHVEWATPEQVKGDSQDRGNSGVFLLGRFEIQILDSFNNRTYPDGQAAAVYGQFPPLVNASKNPGAWQSYDISFTAPTFKGTALESPAIVTVFHNGILVQNAVRLWGRTAHKRIDPYQPADAKGPIGLQDHGNPIRFRNIWIRPLTAS